MKIILYNFYAIINKIQNKEKREIFDSIKRGFEVVNYKKKI